MQVDLQLILSMFSRVKIGNGRCPRTSPFHFTVRLRQSIKMNLILFQSLFQGMSEVFCDQLVSLGSRGPHGPDLLSPTGRKFQFSFPLASHRQCYIKEEQIRYVAYGNLVTTIPVQL